MSLLLAALLANTAAPPGQAVDGFVLTHDLTAGEIISETSFRRRRADDRGTTRGGLSPEEAAGMEATRRLPAGSVVRRTDLRPRQAIRRGERVTISFRSSALTISATGKALGDAAIDEPLRVLNDATHQTIEAVAEAPGRVRVRVQ